MNVELERRWVLSGGKSGIDVVHRVKKSLEKTSAG